MLPCAVRGVSLDDGLRVRPSHSQGPARQTEEEGGTYVMVVVQCERVRCGGLVWCTRRVVSWGSRSVVL